MTPHTYLYRDAADRQSGGPRGTWPPDDRVRWRDGPGLHPALRPQWFDLVLHEGLEEVLHRELGGLLQLVAA